MRADYCTVEQVRAELGDAASGLDATLLAKAVTAASRAVEDWCGRSAGFALDAAASARVYRPTGREVAVIDDIGSADDLTVETWAGAWTVLDADAYQLEPLNADTASAFAWNQLVALSACWPVDGRRATLRVTARWGWSQVPEQVEEATILRAVALFKRKETPYGVADFGEFGPVRIGQQDFDVISLLAPFRVPGIA